MADAGFPIFGDDRSAVILNPDVPLRDLVVITWDGKDTPHGMVHFDQPPNFDLLTFDYSGAAKQPGPLAARHYFLSCKTEGKGQVLESVSKFLDKTKEKYRYVGIIDHDVLIAVSHIHYLLHVGKCFDLDAFAPSLARDAFYSFSHTLNGGHGLLRPVPWIEIMMPFYKTALFKMASPFFSSTISSWGIDKFVIPLVQKIAGMQRTAVIDGVLASHVYPVRSGERLHSNGRNPFQEMEFVRQTCVNYVEANHPELLRTEWFGETFHTLGFKARVTRKVKRTLRGLRIMPTEGMRNRAATSWSTDQALSPFAK